MIEQIPVGPYKNFSYVLADFSSKKAAVIDPAWEVPRIMHFLEKYSLNLIYIINTHVHHDHIEGNEALKKVTSAKVVMSEKASVPKDVGVHDWQQISLGEKLVLRFLLTPGHSPESMCILANDLALFTGDTLFIGECGRVDVPGGDASALYESFEKIRKLNPELVVYPGHDYGPKTFTTLGEQLKENYTLIPRTKG